jgi:hypothetical protein
MLRCTETHGGLHVKCPLLLTYFNLNLRRCTNYTETPQYHFMKIRGAIRCMDRYRRRDGRAPQDHEKSLICISIAEFDVVLRTNHCRQEYV